VGDSIAVNGVCLTALGVDGGRFSADVMNETLDRSSLGAIAAGSSVNLELALRASDRLGGHIVQGHVDGLGTVARVREDGFARNHHHRRAPRAAVLRRPQGLDRRRRRLADGRADRRRRL